MIGCARESFDEIPAAARALFHPVNGDGSRIAYLSYLESSKLFECVSQEVIQSYRASEPPADKPKQEEDLRIPHGLGEVSHEGENKEPGEKIISLNTDGKIRERERKKRAEEGEREKERSGFEVTHT